MTDQPADQELLALFARLTPEVRVRATQALQRMADPDAVTGPFGWLLGIHYLERGPDGAVCTVRVDDALHNPGGVAHGGVVYSLVDSAMGAAVLAGLPPEQRCVTAELKVNYLRAVVTGQITARGTVVQRGKTLAVVTAEVHDDAGQLVAVGLGTFAIVKRRA